MMEINKGIVCNIIEKAKEIDIAEDIKSPDDPSELSDVEWNQLLAEYQNDWRYIELRNLINELEPDQLQSVVALMYIGRGDFEKNEWSAALKQARTIPSSNCADYLISKNMLADYLTEGLVKFNFSFEG
jgi:hypothetical protein